MNYYTIDYDVNRPMANQMTVPMNSEYGIGVRVIKDNEPVNLEMGELSVNGMSATSQVNGYNLYELSSGNDTGMNTLDVEVRKEPTVGKEINPVGEGVNTAPRGRQMMISVPLSAFFDSDITIKPEDVTVLSLKTRNAAYDEEYPDEWMDISNQYINPEHWMTFLTSNNDDIYCIQQSDGHLFCWYNNITDTYEYGEKTIPTSYKICLSYTFVPARKKIEYSAVIQIDTKDGLNTKFPLQVNVADKGYFERRLEN